jgi:hypothetical protein
MAEQALLTLV